MNLVTGRINSLVANVEARAVWPLGLCLGVRGGGVLVSAFLWMNMQMRRRGFQILGSRKDY